MNVYSESKSNNKSHNNMQPGLSAIYQSINDSITEEYLGWPLTCTPLVFNPYFSNRIISIDTLKYNWFSDTICSCNSYLKSGGYNGRLWTSTETISITEYDAGFKIKRNSLKMKLNTPDYLIHEWNIKKLERLYIVPDSSRIHIYDGCINYYSRIIINNGKIVDYRILPNVEIDNFHKYTREKDL